MKMAAAIALAKLAKEEVPQAVRDAYEGKEFKFGRDYLIPTPFDPRLIDVVPVEVAKAAMESGVAYKKIEDWEEYKKELRQRVTPII